MGACCSDGIPEEEKIISHLMKSEPNHGYKYNIMMLGTGTLQCDILQ